MKKIKLLLFLSIFSFFPLWAQIKVGFSGAQFLTIPLSARGAGISNAYVAISGTPSCVFWNPAGLADITTPKAFSADYTQYIVDNYLAGLIYIQDYAQYGKIGIFSGFLHSPNFEEVLVNDIPGSDPEIIITGKTFSYEGIQTGLVYAQKFTAKFSFGLNLKGIYEKYGGYTSAFSFAIDAGTLFYTGFKSFRVAMSMQNLGPNLKPKGSYIRYRLKEDVEQEYKDYPLPLVFRIGGAMEIVETPEFKVTLSVEGVHPNDNEETIALGTEISLLFLSLRGGYIFNSDEGGLSFGFGVYPLGQIGLDYAFSDFGALPDVHRVGLSYKF